MKRPRMTRGTKVLVCAGLGFGTWAISTATVSRITRNGKITTTDAEGARCDWLWDANEGSWRLASRRHNPYADEHLPDKRVSLRADNGSYGHDEIALYGAIRKLRDTLPAGKERHIDLLRAILALRDNGTHGDLLCWERSGDTEARARLLMSLGRDWHRDGDL